MLPQQREENETKKSEYSKKVEIVIFLHNGKWKDTSSHLQQLHRLTKKSKSWKEIIKQTINLTINMKVKYGFQDLWNWRPTWLKKKNFASVNAIYKLCWMVIMSGKSYNETDFVKQYLIKTVEIVCPVKARLFKLLSLQGRLLLNELMKCQLIQNKCLGCFIKIWTLFSCYQWGRLHCRNNTTCSVYQGLWCWI